jgi:hypothetical protein
VFEQLHAHDGRRSAKVDQVDRCVEHRGNTLLKVEACDRLD